MMQQLSDEMDRFFDSFFFGVPGLRTHGDRFLTMWSPEIDITTGGNELCVRVDLPGVSQSEGRSLPIT